MGLAKAHQMEVEERGWEAPEKFVCSECVEDEYLKSVVEVSAEECECSYCERTEEEAIAAPLSAVLKPVADTLNAYFSDPSSASLPRDDGEWVDEGNIVDTGDALESLGLGCEEELFRDISDSFLNTARYPCADGFWLGQHRHERLRSAWSSFEDDIKHRRRYFFNEKNEEQALYERPEYAPLEVLEAVGRVSQEIGLDVSIPAGAAIYRTRRVSMASNYTTFDDLGPPPPEAAIAGRMNPPGIPYFYLSF